MGETYVLSTWLFLRLLGVVYFIAFVSLGRQILGLVGSRDGVERLPYEFKWKPGDVRRRRGTVRWWPFSCGRSGPERERP